MKNFCIILNSTIFVVLFCLSDLFSLPLTRTCYTPPEDKIDMAVKEEFVYIENLNRKDNFSFNLGIPGNSSIGLDFSLIHNNSFEAGESRPGDILFSMWHFTGDFFDGLIDSGLGVVFRIPTGPDAYSDEKYRNLSFGNSEIRFSPVASVNLGEYVNLILNLSYTFREGPGENLYSGFKLNPAKSDTYKSCLGLNPFYKDAFLEGENLKNDYASIAGGIITTKLLPWIFFTEIYYSSRLYRDDDAIENIDIEGDDVNPLLASIGLKYYFSGSFFIQFSDTVSVLKQEGYIRNTSEFSLNIFF